jgi:hypothetical protein
VDMVIAIPFAFAADRLACWLLDRVAVERAAPVSAGLDAEVPGDVEPVAIAAGGQRGRGTSR